ncbi:MAG: dolichol-phosphate mannosyltransferase [Myxococcota bacterium]|jgi:dolichol-phosphate mannosyltransferase
MAGMSLQSVYERYMTPERARFLRFCAVGASGVVVNLGIFTVAMAMLLPGWIESDDSRFLAANGVGFLVSVLTNFLLNDFWTWGDREKRGHAHFWSRLGRFYTVSSVAGVVQLGVAFAVRAYLGVWDQLAVLVGIGVATVINFVANNIWTFKE